MFENIKELCTQQPENGLLKLFLFHRIVFCTNFDLKNKSQLKVRHSYLMIMNNYRGHLTF